MPSVNKVILIGNLTRDPQTKQLPTQSLVTEFGLAMNRKFKSPEGEDREEVCFVDCAAFGRQAEVIQKYCRKGKSLYLVCRLLLEKKNKSENLPDALRDPDAIHPGAIERQRVVTQTPLHAPRAHACA